LRVLVVDDDGASLDAMCGLLELLEICPRRAESGRDALDAMHESQFDILLTDVVMPDMSGRKPRAGR
jgi:CheY-like chemotaxis protein